MSELHTHSDWQAWFDALSAPLSGAICGEDQKYEEDFKFLKSSFSGVGELDTKHIFILGTQLLADNTKDLRVASYLVFAAASEYGVIGATYGLQLFNHFVAEFLADVHPLSNKARKAVHVWLLSQQARMIALIELRAEWRPEQIQALQQQLAVYGEHTVRQLDEDAGPLSDMLDWLDKLAQKHPVIEVTSAPKPKAEVEGKVAPNAPAPQPEMAALSHAGLSVQIDSETNYAKGLRKLLEFDREQTNFARLIGTARAARWSDLSLPPNEQGKTRLPAPRATAFAPIKNALSTDNYHDALLAGEALFMEGAMHFNMDLQALQLSALKGLAEPARVQQLELSLLQLVIRFPQLANLTYEDGTPFCSAKSKDLLTDLVAKYAPSEPASGQADAEYDTAEQQAKALVEEGKLNQALGVLNQLPAHSQFQQANVQLLKARMCLHAERFDFAQPILLTLVEAIEQHQLGQWQPSFAMQVWRSSLLCFETLVASGNKALAEQCQRLKDNMILTQPETALGWI